MSKYIREFIRRGLSSWGLGPVVLAVIYLILNRKAGVDTLTIRQVCTGIFSLSALAFVAGGMNVVYQMERLPLMGAILIHGLILYLCYLATYLVNGWLEAGRIPIIVFTGIFVFGYLIIWAAIYAIIKNRTQKLNEMLKMKQQSRMKKDQ